MKPLKILGIVAAVVVLIVIIVISSVVGRRNQMVTMREAVRQSWSQIDVVIQRRSDLVPNLVETVKGIAAQEREVFSNIADADRDWVRDIVTRHFASQRVVSRGIGAHERVLR